MAQVAFERPCAFYRGNIMISVKRCTSINTLRSESLFDQPVMLDGKVMGIITHNEEDLWDLSDIFSNPGSQIFRLRP